MATILCDIDADKKQLLDVFERVSESGHDVRFFTFGKSSEKQNVYEKNEIGSMQGVVAIITDNDQDGIFDDVKRTNPEATVYSPSDANTLQQDLGFWGDNKLGEYIEGVG